MLINNQFILIGIAGGTSSGKTLLAESISSNFAKSDIVVINQDSFYHDLSNLPLEQRETTNFDHPNSIDYKLIKENIKTLISGNKIKIPIYDFSTHTRSKKMLLIDTHKIVVFEGTLAFYDKIIREMMDIKIYVEASDDIRIIRRLKRDMKKRNRTFNSIINQYNKSVRPMHYKFIEPTKKYADIIIPGEGNNQVSINLLRTI